MLRSSIQRSLFQSDIALVKLREGTVLYWYLDSLGKKTGGTGHLYRKGDPAVFDMVVADKWLEDDIAGARKAAQRQFDKLPIQTQSLYDVLVSCNFQFGNDFDKDFPKTWEVMLQGDYIRALKMYEQTLWFKQTPARVKDLQKALAEAYLLGRQYKDLGL